MITCRHNWGAATEASGASEVACRINMLTLTTEGFIIMLIGSNEIDLLQTLNGLYHEFTFSKTTREDVNHLNLAVLLTYVD